MSYKIIPSIIIGNLVDEISHLRLQNEVILIISSQSVSQNIIVNELCKNIGESNSIFTFFSIKPNAPIQDLDKIVSDFSKPTLIIAIGGGSVIDSAKALSIGWQGSTILDIFHNNKNIPSNSIKVLAVPTTAGTGAELSYGSILFDLDSNTKGGIRGELLQPDKVIIDTQLYLTAPKKLIAEVGFDCLTHAVETYVSTKSTPLVRFQSISAIKTVFENIEKATRKDEHAIEKMAIAASLMGINLALSSTCLPHRIQYAIGPLTSTSHAQGLIALYKGWLEEVKHTQEFQSLSDDLGLSAEGLIAKVKEIKSTCSIDYSLKTLGVESYQIDKITSQVTGNLQSDPCYKSQNTIVNILKNAL
jgi:alcohol dehydrogenase class IV